jgi:hypothetical protein
VKRRDLIKVINTIAKLQGEIPKYTEGGNHTKVQVGNKATVIPRHKEISELLAKKILKQLEG